MTNPTTEASPVAYARIAGFAYVLIIIIGVLYGIFIESRLIVPGNDAATASNIIEHDMLFRTGIAGILVLYGSVVVLSWALYVILKTVNKNLALLAMLLRSAEAILGASTALISFIVLGLLNGTGSSAVLGKEQLQAWVGVFLNASAAGLDIVLIFVGLGGSVFCYLFIVSKYVPIILAGWGIFTYVSMLVLALVSILFPNHPAMLEYVLYALGALFELVFGFWLLFKGVNLQQWDSNVSASPAI